MSSLGMVAVSTAPQLQFIELWRNDCNHEVFYAELAEDIRQCIYNMCIPQVHNIRRKRITKCQKDKRSFGKRV